jgi:hypothetical protein
MLDPPRVILNGKCANFSFVHENDPLKVLHLPENNSKFGSDKSSDETASNGLIALAGFARVGSPDCGRASERQRSVPIATDAVAVQLSSGVLRRGLKRSNSLIASVFCLLPVHATVRSSCCNVKWW